MRDDPTDAILRAESEWARAMVRNDVPAIGGFVHDDWVIVGPDGRPCDRQAFLDLVESGTLTHDVMDLAEPRVRVYGDAAVVTFRSVSGGEYRGQAFRVVERASDVWVRTDGGWRCVLTHLSSLAEGGGP